MEKRVELIEYDERVSDFEIIQSDYNRNLEYQKKKYNIEEFENFKTEPIMGKWNSIYSINETLFLYVPPEPNAPRKLIITNNSVMSFYYDGMYAQFIREFKQVNDCVFEFKLCHNHSVPFKDGFVKASFTIIDKEMGIGVWEEWRIEEQPFIFYFVRHDLCQRFQLLKNKDGVLDDFCYSFDNKLLKKMESENGCR